MSRGSLARLGLLGLVWGTSFLLIKFGLEGVSPVQMVLGRLVSGTAVLLAIVAVRGVALPRGARLWAHLAAMAVVANIVPFALFAYAEQRISSGLAGVLNATTPLFTLLVAVAAGRAAGGTAGGERLGPVRVAGIALGFAGVVVVVAPWRDGALGGTLAGQLAALAAAACYGVGFVYTRRFISPSGYPPLALSAGQLGCGTLLLGAAAPFVATDPVRLTLPVVASVAALGVVMTGLAYLVYYRLIADAGATSASLVTYLIPLVAVSLGVAVLGEPLTWNLFAGAAVTIAGVALAEGRIRRGRVAVDGRRTDVVRV